MYTKESIEGLKETANVVEVLIHVGGVSAAEMTDNGYEVRCCCPIHGGDNPSGFSWRSQEGVWTCFTKGCGEGSGRDVFSFIQLKMGLNFKESVEYLAAMFGYSLEEGEVSEVSNYLKASKIRKDIQSLKTNPSDQLKLASLPGYYPDGKQDVYAYLASRGYHDPAIIEKFNLYPCVDSFKCLRLGIPAYDDKSNLVGVNARKMDGILSYPDGVTLKDGRIRKLNKYEMISNFKKGQVLFNLCRAKEQSLQRGLILVEGELSCIRMVSYGFENTVAIRGSMITKEQALLIYKHCFNLTILVESGEAAEEGTVKILEKLPGLKVSIARLETGDPDDNSKENIVTALNMAKLYTEEDVRYTIENRSLLK